MPGWLAIALAAWNRRPFGRLASGIAGTLLASASAAAAGDEPGCSELYAPDDPALFEFVETRKGVDYSQYAGLQIGRMEYVVLPIFNENDPDEDNWLFRAANWLHIETRESTLEKQMILQSGKPLTVDKLDENERLLRTNDYLIDAMILPRRRCGERLDLLVVVRDIWTFTTSASASRSGGENRSGAGITEKNLLGSGQRLSLGYFQNDDRNGRTLSYDNPHIYKRVELGLDVEDNSDGTLFGLSLDKPFYQLDSRWSAGARVYREDLRQTIKSDDQPDNLFDKEVRYNEMYMGWSPGRKGGSISRWKVGITDDSNTFEALPETTLLPREEVLRYPWVSWSWQQDRFQTTSNVNRSHRQEDVQLGFSHSLRLGYANERFDSTNNAVIINASASYSTFFRQDQLLRTSLFLNGQRDSDALQSSFFGSHSRYYYFMNEKNRWFARLQLDGGRNIRLDEQLHIGGNENLRGYPKDYQHGNRRWLFSVERRRFTNWHILNLAYFGVAGYVDAGRVWSTEGDLGNNNDTLANLGLGLRFSPSKFRVDQVLHVDVAAPLVNTDEVDDYQIIVSGQVDF